MNGTISTERDTQLARSLDVTLRHPVIRHLQQRLMHLQPVDAIVYGDSRLAAVLATIRVTDEGTPEILFIKRATVERDPWSGHIAFPGGRHDASDISLEHTALRETREEVAIDVARYGRVIGRLDDLAPRSPVLPPIIIRPFVAVVPAGVEIARNHEVADAFWTPLDGLAGESARAEHEMQINGAATRFPAYAVREHMVWGLTERIVSQLLPLLG